jgi:hypothetical protein
MTTHPPLRWSKCRKMTKNRTKCCRDLTDVAGARGRQGVFEITFGIAESLEVYRREDPCCCSHCTSRHNATPRMTPTAPKCLGSGAPVAGRLPSSSKFRSYVDPDCLTTDGGGTESPMSTPYVSPPTSELPCRKISLSAATISSHPAHSALPLPLSPARASRQRWRGRASTAVSVFLFSFFYYIYIYCGHRFRNRRSVPSRRTQRLPYHRTQISRFRCL